MKHSKREMAPSQREVAIIDWNELPILKDDGAIPLTKEIYKVLRRFR